MTFTRLIDINTDIRDAYGEARAKMEAVELMHGVLITRGASLSYKAALKQVMTEPGAGPDDMVDWPVRATQVVAFISDLEQEYLKLYRHEGYGTKARDALGEAAGALETLVDYILNAGPKEAEPEPEPEPETGVSLIDMDTRIKDAYTEAMSKVEAAASVVEKTKNPETAQAYKQLLEETCTRKNLGFKTLLEPVQQLAAAWGIVGEENEAYFDMYIEAEDAGDMGVLRTARNALENLSDIIGTVKREEEDEEDDE